jgi:hypothetical protein
MRITGITADGREVVGDLFKAHDTDGLPLSLSLTFIESEGMVPDLYGFVLDAALAGWKAKSIVMRIREAVIEVHGPNGWAWVEERLTKQLELFNIG